MELFFSILELSLEKDNEANNFFASFDTVTKVGIINKTSIKNIIKKDMVRILGL
jgi:hypothetical protein